MDNILESAGKPTEKVSRLFTVRNLSRELPAKVPQCKSLGCCIRQVTRHGISCQLANVVTGKHGPRGRRRASGGGRRKCRQNAQNRPQRRFSRLRRLRGGGGLIPSRGHPHPPARPRHRSNPPRSRPRSGGGRPACRANRASRWWASKDACPWYDSPPSCSTSAASSGLSSHPGGCRSTLSCRPRSSAHSARCAFSISARTGAAVS